MGLQPEATMLAAYAYVDTMISKADATTVQGAPLWHGWALREAWLAGYRHAEKERDETLAEVARLRAALTTRCEDEELSVDSDAMF
jgi:hypothetical protein